MYEGARHTIAGASSILARSPKLLCPSAREGNDRLRFSELPLFRVGVGTTPNGTVLCHVASRWYNDNDYDGCETHDSRSPS